MKYFLILSLLATSTAIGDGPKARYAIVTTNDQVRTVVMMTPERAAKFKSRDGERAILEKDAPKDRVVIAKPTPLPPTTWKDETTGITISTKEDAFTRMAALTLMFDKLATAKQLAEGDPVTFHDATDTEVTLTFADYQAFILRYGVAVKERWAQTMAIEKLNKALPKTPRR